MTWLPLAMGLSLMLAGVWIDDRLVACIGAMLAVVGAVVIA